MGVLILADRLLQIVRAGDAWQVLDSRGAHLGSFDTSEEAKAFGDGYGRGRRDAASMVKAALATLADILNFEP